MRRRIQDRARLPPVEVAGNVSFAVSPPLAALMMARVWVLAWVSMPTTKSKCYATIMLSSLCREWKRVGVLRRGRSAMGHTRFACGHASNQASAVDRTDAGPGQGGHIQESALRKARIGGKPMGESHPSQATTPACQPLTEQPGKVTAHGRRLSDRNVRSRKIHCPA